MTNVGSVTCGRVIPLWGALLWTVVTPAKSLSLKTVILAPFRTIRISPESTSHSRILPLHHIIFRSLTSFASCSTSFLPPISSISSLFVPPSIAAPFRCQRTTLFYPLIQRRTISPRSRPSEPRAPFFPFIQQSTTLFLNRFDMSCNITFGRLTSSPRLLVSLDCLVSRSLSQEQARRISLEFFLLILTLSLYY